MVDVSAQRNQNMPPLPDSSIAAMSAEFQQELIAIANWWIAHSMDHEQGGFFGEISADNLPVKNASKGIVLNTRILWFFSEVAIAIDDPAYRAAATRAYEYLVNYFLDKEHGGVFWELDSLGNPLNTKKQTYAQAFAIYALCAYYNLTRDDNALAQALDCFALLEEKTVDHDKQGYFEAFTRGWGKIEDVRLSDKDLNFPKSMNTHLHVLEAYTTLYKVKPTEQIKQALRYNIECFDNYMIDKNTWHLRMFMDNDWHDFSPGLTYGHDIECSWLLSKALDSLGDSELTQALSPVVIKIAEVTLAEAIGDHGEVADALDFSTQKKLTERIWWVQAEALVGFLNAYSLTREASYLQAAGNVWNFIKKYHRDPVNGEWFWLSTLDGEHAGEFYKVGFWKGPYHNGRAMLEGIRFLKNLKHSFN